MDTELRSRISLHAETSKGHIAGAAETHLGVTLHQRELGGVRGLPEVGGHVQALAGERHQVIRPRRVLLAVKAAQVQLPAIQPQGGLPPVRQPAGSRLIVLIPLEMSPDALCIGFYFSVQRYDMLAEGAQAVQSTKALVPYSSASVKINCSTSGILNIRKKYEEIPNFQTTRANQVISAQEYQRTSLLVVHILPEYVRQYV